MARLRVKNTHLLPGVRIIQSRYYYQSTREDESGNRACFPLGKIGEETKMRSEWSKRHLHPHTIHPITHASVGLDCEMVYFVQVKRAVKIGYTTSRANLKMRLDDFQVASPYPVKLLGAVAGDRVAEKTAHRALAAHSLSGEWFSKNSAVCSYIAHAFALGRIPV